MTVPFQAQITILTSMPGIDRLAAEVIIAEIGGDISKFPTAGQLCAWAGVAPSNHESAGKRRNTPARKGSRHLRTAMVEAGKSAANTKASYYHALKGRIAARHGGNKATVAVAHSMLETIWYLLTNGTLFDDPGADYYTRRLDPELEKKRLLHRLEALGCRVTIEPAA